MSGKPATAAVGLLGSARARKRLVAALAETMPVLVDGAFVMRATPEGGPWAKRKDRKKHQLLELTRKMRNTVRTTVSDNRVSLTTDVNYLRFHQHGTVKMVARRLAPKGKMPPSWLKVLNQRMLAELRKLQRGQ